MSEEMACTITSETMLVSIFVSFVNSAYEAVANATKEYDIKVEAQPLMP